MSSDKIALLESSLDFLKEKVRIQSRRWNPSIFIEPLCSLKWTALKLNAQLWTHLHQGRKNKTFRISIHYYLKVKVQNKPYLVFTGSLKKVDANATANIKKLEEYFTDLIQDQQYKFS